MPYGIPFSGITGNKHAHFDLSEVSYHFIAGVLKLQVFPSGMVSPTRCADRFTPMVQCCSNKLSYAAFSRISVFIQILFCCQYNSL